MANRTQKHVLMLDLGSTGLRSLTAPVDQPWSLTPGAERRYRVGRPRGADSLVCWFEPNDLWQRVAAVLGEGVRAAGVAPEDVAAVSITSQRQGVAFLDRDGATIYLAPNVDLRAVFEGAAIDDRLADQVHAATGHLPSFLFTPAKLHWWRRQHPRTSRRIHRILTLGAWVAYRLTGEQADVPSQLNEAGLADVATRQPSALLDALEVDGSLLPSVVDEGAAVGAVQHDAAAATGLREGTPVVLAGPDTQAALLGMGAVAPGDAAVVSGWSTPVQAVTEAPVLDPQRRTWAGCHVLPGRWVAEANVGDTGGTLEMVRRLLGPRAGIDRLDSLLSRSRLGSNLVTAFWGPHALDLANPGVGMGGLLMPSPITYNPIHAGHVARATLENIAYGIRQGAERLEEVMERKPRLVALSGGLSQNSVFPQMLADVLGSPVRLHHHRASAIGAAIAASAPRGQWEEAAKRAAGQGTVIEPDVRSTLEYADLYRRWLRLKARLDELSDEL